MTPAAAIEKEIQLSDMPPGIEKFYKKVQQGTFLESLKSAEECSELLAFECFRKQFIIFIVALFNRKDKKRASEIFDVLREKLGNKFFEVPVSLVSQKVIRIEDMTRTALHIAASENRCAACDEDVVDILIKQGININHLDNEGYTPLNTAIWWENEVVFNALLNAGTNLFPTETSSPINYRNEPTSALCFLLHRGKQGSVQMRMFAALIARGANPNMFMRADIPAYFHVFFPEQAGDKYRDFYPRLAKIFLSSEKLDLSLRSKFKDRSGTARTALEIAELLERSKFSAKFKEGQKISEVSAKFKQKQKNAELDSELELLQDHIREKCAKRLVAVEKTLLETVSCLPRVVCNLISHYEFTDDKFEQYVSSPFSLTFLYRIVEDDLFKTKVREETMRSRENVETMRSS